MSDNGSPLDRAQRAWRALWLDRGNEIWARDAATFLPYDRLAVLRDRAAILEHWQTRRKEYSHVADRWTPLAEWTWSDSTLLAAEVEFDLAPVSAKRLERRTMTVTIAFTHVDRYFVSHLGEAIPAALVTMLMGYQREAKLP